MKRIPISSLVLLAVLPLLGAAQPKPTFVGTFAVDEEMWEREAREAVEQNKVVLSWTVEDMVAVIKFESAAAPSVEIKKNGTYLERSAYFGIVYGKWQLKKGTLIAKPDRLQPDVCDHSFKPAPFTISLRSGVYRRYADGVDGPSDLPLKSLDPK
jgi:hypothetical protein